MIVIIKPKQLLPNITKRYVAHQNSKTDCFVDLSIIVNRINRFTRIALCCRLISWLQSNCDQLLNKWLNKWSKCPRHLPKPTMVCIAICRILMCFRWSRSVLLIYEWMAVHFHMHECVLTSILCALWLHKLSLMGGWHFRPLCSSFRAPLNL